MGLLDNINNSFKKFLPRKNFFHLRKGKYQVTRMQYLNKEKSGKFQGYSEDVGQPISKVWVPMNF